MKTEMEYKVEFGKQVKKYLDASGLSENDLAKLLNSSIKNVTEIISGNVGLTIDKMIKIGSIFNVTYYNLANPNFPLPNFTDLDELTKDLIEKRKITGVKTKDKNHALANELNRLIKEGSLNQPNTAKNLLTHMTPSLWKRNPSEITSLLNKAPRNESIVLIRPIKGVNYYIHKDFKGKYATLSDEEILALVVPFESPDNEKYKS
ncbi:helix-turn-helix domain-containing protein [Sphingobacterium sp. SG20118]|uniref:helix-turn-helix domain-containing protein n=1 Tax=Sphingobacterium sp. SG20118 TaxID=3367156 RepID=UPI0037DFBE1A